MLSLKSGATALLIWTSALAAVAYTGASQCDGPIKPISCPFRTPDLAERYPNQKFEQTERNFLEKRLFIVPDGGGSTGGLTNQQPMAVEGFFFKDILPLYRPAVLPYVDVDYVKGLLTPEAANEWYRTEMNKPAEEGIEYGSDFTFGKRTRRKEHELNSTPRTLKFSEIQRPLDDILVSEEVTALIKHVPFFFPQFQPSFQATVDLLNSDLGSSIFVAPPYAASNIQVHFDATEVFINQLHGKKTYRLWDPALIPQFARAPRRGDFENMKFEHLASRVNSTIDITLGAGDLLYIPAGWVHEVFTEDEFSMHTSYGAVTTHTFQLLNNAVLALKETHPDDELFTASASKKLKWADVMVLAIASIAKDEVVLREWTPVCLSTAVSGPLMKAQFTLYKRMLKLVKKRLAAADNVLELACIDLFMASTLSEKNFQGKVSNIIGLWGTKFPFKKLKKVCDGVVSGDEAFSKSWPAKRFEGVFKLLATREAFGQAVASCQAKGTYYLENQKTNRVWGRLTDYPRDRDNYLAGSNLRLKPE